MVETRTLQITGKVQGVFYRQSTVEKARQLGVVGYVINLPDGRVFIKATGTAQQLDALEAWCRVGPPKAIVSQVETGFAPLEQFSKFEIRR
jgi:acylphosphatase